MGIVILVDNDNAPHDRHPRGEIQAYAMRMILSAAQSAVEDDLDEDGRLACFGGCDHSALCPDHEAACELAQKIIDQLEARWLKILGWIEEPAEGVTLDEPDPPY